MDEIELKFLVKKLPNISNIQAVSYERYYIYADKGVELRVQRKNDEYELERKVANGNLSRSSTICLISAEEFNLLKILSDKKIVRKSYQLSKIPNVTIQIYEDDYEGLIRAEFEFSSEKNAKSFIPPEWCGLDITDSILGRDSRLVSLTKESFQLELKSKFRFN